MTIRPVVVGVDSVLNNDHALQWAIREAAAAARPLRVLHGYGTVLTSSGSPAGYAQTEVEHLRKAAEELVARTVHQAHMIAPDLDVSGIVEAGDARHALIAESDSASVVVLGSRHLPALGATLIGSVGCGVAAGAHCPVVVVRAAAGSAAEGAGVVVGVDGTEVSEDALGFAFEHASLHALPLRAVMCWHRDPLASIGVRPEHEPPERARLLLSEALAGWQEKYPDVIVDASIVRDHPVSRLVADATAQQLLVVATSHRHAFIDTVLGSVTQGVLHHAVCPVAVVPARLAGHRRSEPETSGRV